VSIPEPIPKPPADTFALFVRAVEGHIVRRFGTSHTIGYTFDPPTKDGPGGHRWDTETIHALTDREVLAYRGEYDHEIRDGGLVACTREAWEKQVAERRKKHDAAKEKRRADEKRAAEAKDAPPPTKNLKSPAAPAEGG